MSAIGAIDPGRTGFVVGVDSDGIAWSVPFPATHRGLVNLLTEHRDLYFFVEEQSMRSWQAHQTTILVNYGVILGVLLALDIRHEVVPPKAWQAAMLKGLPKVKGPAIKRQYTEVAERMFPRTNFSGPRGGILDGKAAAALIGEYGRRKILGSHGSHPTEMGTGNPGGHPGTREPDPGVDGIEKGEAA